jgi:hypothetical protein
MNILKIIFPIAFMAREKNSNSLVLGILLHVAVDVLYFLVSGLVGFFFGNVAAWLLGLFGTLVGLYSTGGIVLSVLRYCGIIK